MRFSTIVGLCLALVALLFSPAILCSASADESGSNDEVATSGKIIGRIWNTKVSMGQMMNYTQKLSKELEMPQSPIMMMVGGGEAMGASILGSGGVGGGAAVAELKGTVVFLETSPTPGTPHFISFRNVKDLAEFQKIVRQAASMMGPMGELLGEDENFEVKMNLKRISEGANITLGDNPGDDDGKPLVQAFTIEIKSEIALGGAQAKATGEAMPGSFSTFYRYHDGIMYSSQLKALSKLELPSLKSMQIADENAGDDIHAQFDLTQIPQFLKQQLWMVLQAEALTYMQRFDDENPGDYSVRHAIGQGRLELLKAAMFDVDKAKFSLKLPETDETPIKAMLKIEARDESQLAQSLKQLNRTPSRLGALRNNESPLVVSTSFDLPDWTQPLAKTFVESLQVKLQESTDDAAVKTLIGDLFLPVLKAAEEGQLDAAVRMDGNFEEGMVLAGGLRLPDAEQFHSCLETLLLVGSANGRFSVGRSQIGESQAVTIASENLSLPFLDQQIPVQLHLVGSGNYVWFSLGGPNASSVLESQIGNQESVLNAQTESMPLHVRLRLSEWLSGDSEGFSKVPYMALMKAEQFVSDVVTPVFGGASITMNGVNVTAKKPEFTSFADKTLKGNAADLEVSARTFGRTLSVDASIGTGVAKFIVAQYAAAQNRMFSNIKFDFNPAMLKDAKGKQIQSIRIGN